MAFANITVGLGSGGGDVVSSASRGIGRVHSDVMLLKGFVRVELAVATIAKGDVRAGHGWRVNEAVGYRKDLLFVDGGMLLKDGGGWGERGIRGA